MNETVIPFSEVFLSLSNPIILKNKYVRLCFQMMAMEQYITYSRKDYTNQYNLDKSRRWRSIIKYGEYPPYEEMTKPASSSLRAILAYTILKVINSQDKYAFRIGIIKVQYGNFDTIYLVKINTNTILTDFTRDELNKTVFIRDERNHCEGYDILQYELLYQHEARSKAEISVDINNLIDTVDSKHIIGFRNGQALKKPIESLMDPMVDFAETIYQGNIWNGISSITESNKHDYDNRLITAIFGLKVYKGINIIFQAYPPYGCEY